MNENLIKEFRKLIEFTKDKIDNYKKNKNTNIVNQTSFKLRIFINVLNILKNYNLQITLDNYKKLKNIQGIGKGSLDRIKEILETGKLKEIGKYKDIKNEKTDAIANLEQIIGVGRVNALNFYEKGITNIKKLKQAIKDKKIIVNDKVLLGLKYHKVYQQEIPRSEIDEYYKLIKYIIKKINKKLELPEKKQYVFEICGSYRRGKLISGDIDVLISKKGTKLSKDKSAKHLERFIKKFKTQLKHNDNKPLLLDDMTDKDIKTKYMGFSRLKNNLVRRIDIRFIPYSSYYYALLYFTGSGEHNKIMRNIAKKMGYKLSEYGLFDKNKNNFKVKSERDIFNHLNMEYLNPKMR
jgi:DNA polymerase/3'-5' exonuclease PolX